MKTFACALLAAAGLGLMGAPTSARADDSLALAPNWLDEVRLGVFDHSGVDHNPRHDEGAWADGAFEVISKPVEFYSGTSTPWRVLLNPRFDLGATLNFHGKTSLAYTGLVWRMPVVGPLYLEGQFGGAYNNSPRGTIPGRLDIGCPITFHEFGGVGWRISEHFDAVLGIEHISHAGLCGGGNVGLTNPGVKIGYVF